MSSGQDRRWKVGELAKATGLTVRGLHHYDDVGLLVPSERTEAGHRLYAEQDVRRLYRILALRRLGLSLAEIASVLDDESVSLLETVRRHLAHVERELERQHTLRERLRQILDALERSVEPPAEEFIEALEAMTVIEASVEDVLIRLPADEAEELPHALPARATASCCSESRAATGCCRSGSGPRRGTRSSSSAVAAGFPARSAPT